MAVWLRSNGFSALQKFLRSFFFIFCPKATIFSCFLNATENRRIRIKHENTPRLPERCYRLRTVFFSAKEGEFLFKRIFQLVSVVRFRRKIVRKIISPIIRISFSPPLRIRVDKRFQSIRFVHKVTIFRQLLRLVDIKKYQFAFHFFDIFYPSYFVILLEDKFSLSSYRILGRIAKNGILLN